MGPEQLLLEEAAERHAGALRWRLDSSRFSAEMAPVLQSLEALARSSRKSRAFERARAWRMLGDAWLDLALAVVPSRLDRAIDAYGKALRLFARCDADGVRAERFLCLLGRGNAFQAKRPRGPGISREADALYRKARDRNYSVVVTPTELKRA